VVSLKAVLAHAAEERQEIPCQSDDARLWSSRRREDREAACWRCGSCPVLDPCRVWAIGVKEISGVWGGLDTHRHEHLDADAARPSIEDRP
jgi:hypothetical protein